MNRKVALKSFFFSLCLFSIPFYLYGNEDSRLEWIKSAVEAKMKVQKELKKYDMPVISTWMRKGMRAETFVVDLESSDILVLITDGGPDGIGSDHAVWGNARLFRKDGSVVWLDEIDYISGKAGWNVPMKNKNDFGGPISIAGKKYSHSMFCHANGILVYQLGREFVRFEAEVGIDDSAGPGSVYFKALNAIPENLISEFKESYPQCYKRLSVLLDNLESWIVTPDTHWEKNYISRLISSFPHKDIIVCALERQMKYSLLKIGLVPYLNLLMRRTRYQL